MVQNPLSLSLVRLLEEGFLQLDLLVISLIWLECRSKLVALGMAFLATVSLSMEIWDGILTSRCLVGARGHDLYPGEREHVAFESFYTRF